MAVEPVSTRDPHDGPLVLVVAIAGSIHTARWLNMLLGRGLRFVLLPIYREEPIKEINGRPIRGRSDLDALTDREIGVFDVGIVDPAEVEALDGRLGYRPWRPHIIAENVIARPGHLRAAIRLIQPDLVHSMEVQYAGYLCAATKRFMEHDFPVWLLSNWGSDIYLYRKIPEHQPRLAQVVELIDGYMAECRRDIGIVRELGFRGQAFTPMPASGGMNFDRFPPLDRLPRPSARRDILIKGYHGWSGRALHILNALHLAAPALRGFRIRVTLANEAVRAAVARIAEWDKLDVSCEPYLPDHDAALDRLSAARTVVGLGISDGISTTLLEAMAVGTFPIQGSGSCGCEWIEPGRTGFIVSPHDTESLADAIVHAVTDDAMVDAASVTNRRTVEQRWNAARNGALAAEAYRRLIGPDPDRNLFGALPHPSAAPRG